MSAASASCIWRSRAKLSRRAEQIADRGRGPGLLRQPVGRHLLARHHALLPRDRRALYRHRRRAVAGLLFRQVARQRGAHQLRAARDGAGRAPRESGRNDRDLLLRRQSRHGLLVRQAGAGQSRRRSRRQGARAEDEGRMGRASRSGSASRACISPSATRSAPSSPKPRNVFVNTWSIEGFLSEGMQPAELGWGTHEKWAPANAGFQRAAAARRSTSTSPAPTRACAPGRRPRGRSSASSSPTTSSISIADYYTVRDEQGRGGLPADLPLRLSPLRRRGA